MVEYHTVFQNASVFSRNFAPPMQIFEIVFSDDMRVRKNTLRGAPVRHRRAGSAAKPQKSACTFLILLARRPGH
ncbi:MAG: hypothetical protein II045_04085, partial [Oscillospiraceae bacterium]|nr:hypothetical protein [Oscillospiraceae bacterium]